MRFRLDRLVYRSVFPRPTDLLSNLAALPGEAQRNTARAGLTGSLGVHKADFLQMASARIMPGLEPELEALLADDASSADQLVEMMQQAVQRA